MITIFEDTKPAKNEHGISRDIKAIRYLDGSVDVVIGSWSDWNDVSVKEFRLSAGKAEAFGRVLLCMDDKTFDDITTRAEIYET